MAQKWRTVRVFISSTFRDMHAERDHLVRFVFPRLREELLKRRIHLVDVDLRWGVTSDQDALEVCREIIDECRPRFLCILGGRYGWTPPGREQSITAAEVQYGVLDRISQHGYAFFYFRDPTATVAMDEEEPGEFREPMGSENEVKLAALKKVITDAGLNPFVYPARWDTYQKRLIALETFGNRVYSHLLWSINDEFGVALPEPLNEFAEENAAMEAFVEERVERYIIGSRQSILDELTAFVEADGEPNICVVTGTPGCGKSALFAKFYSDYTSNLMAADRGQSAVVISHFIGVSAGSTNLRRSLRRLCHELNTATGANTPVPEDIKELIQKFPDFLNQASQLRRVVLILDALNQLDAADNAHSLHWLPRSLPPNVRVVVSSLEHRVLEGLRQRGKALRQISLQRLVEDDEKTIIHAFLQHYHKRMTAEQIATLLRKPDAGSPLYLLVALEELRMLGTYEEITDRIRGLPGETQRMFIWILKRLEVDPGFCDSEGNLIGTELVRKFVSYLSVSRHGLSQMELSELIAPGDPRHDPPIPPDPQGNVPALQRLLRSHLMHRGELLDFYHNQLRESVQTEYLDKEQERIRAHRALSDYFRRKADPAGDSTWNGNSPRGLSELPYHIIGVRSWKDAFQVLTDFEFLSAKCGHVDDGIYALQRDFKELLHEWTVPAGEKQVVDHSVITAIAQVIGLQHREWAKDSKKIFQQVYPHLYWWGRLRPINGTQLGIVGKWVEQTAQERTTSGKVWLRQVSCPPVETMLTELNHEKVTHAFFIKDGEQIITVGRGVKVWSASDFRPLPCVLSDVRSGRVLAQSFLGATTGLLDRPAALFRENHLIVVEDELEKEYLEEKTCNKVRIYNLVTGQPECSWITGEIPIRGIACSQSLGILASTTLDRAATLWRLPDGTRLMELLVSDRIGGGVWADPEYPKPGTTWPSPPAFSPDGRLVAIGHGDKLSVWQAEDGEQVAHLVEPHDHELADGPLVFPIHNATHVTFSPDGSRVAVGTWNGSIRIWDIRTNSPRKFIKSPGGFVTGLAWSSGGKLLACYATGELFVWDADSDNPPYLLLQFHSPPTFVGCSGDGSSYVTTETGEICKVGTFQRTERSYWKSRSRNPRQERKDRKVAWSRDGLICVSGPFGSVAILDGESGNLMATRQLSRGELSAIAWEPQGHEIYLGTTDGELIISSPDLKNWNALRLPGFEEIDLLKSSIDGRAILISRISGGISCVWDRTSDSFVAVPNEEGPSACIPIGTAAIAANGSFFASVRTLATGLVAKIWRVSDKAIQHVIPLYPAQGDHKMASVAAFASEGRFLWIGGASWNYIEQFGYPFCLLFDMYDGKCQKVFQGSWRDGIIISLDIQPNGDLVAFSTESRIYIWSIAKGRLMNEIEYKYSVEARNLSWSPCGRYLAAGGTSTVVVWDAEGNAVAKMHSRGVRGNLDWYPEGLGIAFVEASGEPCILWLKCGHSQDASVDSKRAGRWRQRGISCEEEMPKGTPSDRTVKIEHLAGA